MDTGAILLFLRRWFHISSKRRRTFESPRYLFKWLLISTVIGLGAGIGIVLFYEAIHWFTVFALGQLVGYLPPQPAGEGSTRYTPLWNTVRPWLLPVVTMAGAGLAGLIVYKLAPEAEGHGTDASITAFHQGKSIRWRTPLVKLLTSALLIGTGGSAGPEGPAGQIGAGVGSLVARLLHLDTQDGRIALASGMGAGIGAIFRAPLGGALLATEILYKDDLEVDALIPALISSIVAYSVFGVWVGWNAVFALPDSEGFSSPLQLIYYVILGALCGGVGLLFARGIHGIEAIAKRITLPFWVKTALGGLLVGLAGLALPQILAQSYGWVQIEMGRGIFTFPILILVLLPFVKILTTGFSVSSGGPGGLFGPGMVIGGMLGAAVWRLCYHILPGLPPLPAPFVIISMMAVFGSISRAPLAMMLMVAEMTGNLSLLAPAMITVGVAYLIVGHRTMYPAQPNTRADSPAHRLQLSFPLLAALTARQAMRPLEWSLRVDQTLAAAMHTLTEHNAHGAPVLDARAYFVGILTQKDIQRVSPDLWNTRQASTAMTKAKDALIYAPDLALDEALEDMTTRRLNWAPIIDPDDPVNEQRVLGLLTAGNIMKKYRTSVARDVKRMRGLANGTVMLETTVERGMHLANRPLQEANLPKESMVVSIRHDGELVFPQGSTVIAPGDTVTFLVNPTSEVQLQDYLDERWTTSARLAALPGVTPEHPE